MTGSAAVAQQRTQLKGSVADSASKEMLEMATVSVQDAKDSSLITYTLTDNKGAFRLSGLPANKPVRLLVSYTGYRTFSKILGADRTDDAGNIHLAMAATELNTVVVEGDRPPIAIRKDTIEFNAAAFKTKPNAVVEDLLKKLPGVEVDENGGIKVNGKTVSRILVDGKEFFGNDPKLATKNLPSAIVDKVQVVDTKTKQEAKLGIEKDGEDRTINVTLKADKKQGYFGRLSAGGGTDDRFELSGMLNAFSGSRQISVLGSSNNLNKIGFTQNEMMTASERKGGGMYMSVSSEGALNMNGINFGAGGEGIRTASMAGYNYNDAWGKNVNVNNSYSFNNTDARFTTRTNNQYNDGRNISGIRSGNGRNYSHNVALSLDVELDSMTTLNIAPKFGYTRQTSNTSSIDTTYLGPNDLGNTNHSANLLRMNRLNFENSIGINRILNKNGQAIGFTFANSYNTQDGNAFNNSTQQFFEDNVLDSTKILDQKNVINSRNERYDISLYYGQPLSKTWKLHLDYKYSYGISTSNRNTYNFDGDLKGYTDLDSLYSNRFRTINTTHQPSLRFNHSSADKKLNASIGAAVYFTSLDNRSYLDNTSLKQDQTNFAPNSRISYKLKNNSQLSLNYSGYMMQPSVEQLQPVRDNTNPLNIRIGNADLKPQFNHNVSIQYAKYSPTGFGTFSSIGFSPMMNRFSTITRVNANGGQTVQTVNVDGAYSANVNLGGSYSKKTKDWQMRANGNLYGNFGRQVNFSNINNPKGDTAVRKNVSQNLMLAPFFSISYAYKEVFEMSVNYRPGYNRVKSQLNDVTTSNFTQRLSVGATGYLPKGFFVENDLAYTYNSQTAPGFKKGIVVYNAALGFDFLKEKRAQVKLYAYDLLRQNTNIRRNVTELGTFDTQTDLIEQYFMVTLSYNISKFGKVRPSRRYNGGGGFMIF
ncbi:outer membrane beta-barrel protein [Chitinophaga sp. GCM10012297]|uniref:TonB-dependent receptor n=1 Tax=Chitinophaga chungangae TaxID=2821488 RepID=A0ABS3Y8X9_9BACT|nr:outer membrane beta-barrel protein [Chitinophaga chungangae]MBO9151138.1 TonB-dependent receptor [Chitinophaga chungangae]